MLKPKAYLSKFNFLAIEPRTEVVTLNWLTAFFIFAACVILFSEQLPSYVRQYSFQVFLLISIISISLTGWRPLLGINAKVVVTIFLLLFVYFGALGILELVMHLFGVTGVSNPLTGRSDWFLLAVLAPFLEEIFFRDLVLKAFFYRLNRLWLAIFLSSLLFMAAHLTLYPGAFFLGIIGCILVIFTKSLWPSIAFHSISNLSLIFIPAWFPKIWQFLIEQGLVSQFYR